MRFTLSAFADEISPDLDVQLATLKRLQLDGLDLRSVDGTNVLDLTDAQVENVRIRCAEEGIQVQAVGSPVNKVVLSDENRKSELVKLDRSIAVAKLLQVRRIRIFSPEVPTEGNYDAEVDAWMAEQIALAEQHDVLLLHENDAKFYGAYPDNARHLFEKFAGPHFQAAFDFANTVLLGYRPWDDWFPWILPYLDTIHIKDAKPGVGVVAAGEGEGQLKETFRFLREQNWEGTLTMEPHLSAAGLYGGFSGERLFETAVAALRRTLDEA